MLWEIDIYPAPGQADRAAAAVESAAADLNLAGGRVAASQSYLVEAEIGAAEANRIARELLVDGVVERAVVAPVGDSRLTDAAAAQLSPGIAGNSPQLVHVLRKPGVM